jgi:hypothetical protein
MIIDFNKVACITKSSQRTFGLCDDPSPAENPAYIDEVDGEKWIAVVDNPNQYKCIFTALDNCIDSFRADDTMEKRCDGVLTYNSSVIFVELKQRSDKKGRKWVNDAENQLRKSIEFCEDAGFCKPYRHKLAYIANSEKPKERSGQIERMNRFAKETGYVLRIQARIELE